MSTEFGAAQRELFERSSARLYEAAVEAGGLADCDPRIAESSVDRAAFDLLVDLGLLTHDPGGHTYLPVDPVVVQSRIVAPMGQRAAELLDESGRWANAFATLGQGFRRATPTEQLITEIRGGGNINRSIQAAVDDAQEELLTAQPTIGRSATALEQSARRDIRAVQRGVSMRTLYQHSARRSVLTREYVARTTEHGAQARTLDEFFNRLIVVDRVTAFLPGAEGLHVAIAVHEPNLVAYLADIFERYWERATPFDDRDEKTTRDIASDVRTMTVRMLKEGHSDPVSAKRVGVSTRTYAAYIASLKEEFAVQTRFQLGYAMGQQNGQQNGQPNGDRTDRSQ